jgi:hypothetical protein
MTRHVDRMSDAVPAENPPFSSAGPQDELELDRFHQRHVDGDRIAVWECLVWCQDKDLVTPQWAAALAERARAYLERKAPVGVLVGQRRGRHGDPRVERQEKERRELSVASSRAVVCAGLHGRERILAAADVYDYYAQALGIPGVLDTETMQKQYWTWQRDGASRTALTDPHALLVTCSGQFHAMSQAQGRSDPLTVSGALTLSRL